MKANLKLTTCAVVLLGLLGAASAVHATNLPPGSVDVFVVPTAFSAGTVVADTGTRNYSFGFLEDNNTGTVREWVVSDGNRKLCNGCLAFVYQFHVTTGSITGLSGALYDNVTVDVAHSENNPPVSLLPGSLAGQFGANNADRDSTGNTIDFDFTSPVTATFNSWVLIANTDRTSFFPGVITLHSGLALGVLPGFAPAPAAVPEPTTILLIGASLTALVWRRRS
jgi:hypothetical protein